MARIRLDPIAERTHSNDVFDLAERASDYVVLEIGHAPDQTFVHNFFNAVPPEVPKTGLHTFGVMQEDAMVGIVAIAAGYEFHDDWWIGLLLLDKHFRGQGLGAAAVDAIKARAKAEDIAMLKLSVLDANPRAAAFWRREGFVPHRHAPATPGSDGHDRTVLKFIFRLPPDRPF